MTLLQDALTWWKHGHLPLPIRPDGTKRPATTWAQWTEHRPELADWVNLFNLDHDGIGIICGTASGGLEMIEAEGRAIDAGILPELAQTFADHDLQDLWNRIDNGYSEHTPSGGVHWYVRVDGPVPRNTKLARDEHGKVLLETRGQGGFTVVAPSAGRTHDTGKAWTVRTGSIANIPVLSADDLDTVHALFSLHDRTPEPDLPPIPTGAGGSATGDGDRLRPGDDFNTRATWGDILTPHGWRHVRTVGTTRMWAKPGKSGPGHSATTGHAGTGTEDRLYVFSTETEFDTERPYSKFAAHAVLNHNGDMAAAARQLRNDGYGDPDDGGVVLTLNNNPASAGGTGGAGGSGSTTLRRGKGHLGVVDGTAALNPDPQPAQIATSLTDQGNADLLAHQHAHRLRWVPSRGLWLTWDGARWRWCDDDGEATQLAVATLRAIAPDSDQVAKHVTRSLSRRGLEAMVKLAAKHPDMRVAMEDLDADPWVLNTPGGLVDVRTGELRDPNPADNCTRIATVTPQPGPADRWLAFLADTFGADEDMIAYVQRLAGYCTLGNFRHHVLPFNFGGGGNGKSQFMEVLVGILGDYASTAPPDFLMVGKSDESAIARLAGLRLVACSEVNQNARFDEAKVKLLTGGDSVTARFLYGRHFTFTPSAKLWLSGNHQPRVEAGGQGFWRRLRLLPFTQTVPKHKKVEGLSEQLREAEGPQILAWMLEGARALLEHGMDEPEQVLAATERYEQEEDALARFVGDRLMVGGGDAAREPTAKVRRAYAEWCRDEGEREVSAQAFTRELRIRWGIQSGRSNGIRYYVGATLYATEDEPEEMADRWMD